MAACVAGRRRVSTIAAVARRVAQAIPTAQHVVLVRDRCGRDDVVDAVLAELHARGRETVVERVSNARLREIVSNADVAVLATWDAERAHDTARVEAVVSLGGWPADLAGLPDVAVAAWAAASGRVEAELEARRVPMVLVAVPTVAIAHELGMHLDDLDELVFGAIAVSSIDLAAATAPVLAMLAASDQFDLVTSSGVTAMRRDGRPLLVDDGVIDAGDIAAGAIVSNLPAGSVYWTVDEECTRGSAAMTDGSVFHFDERGRVATGPLAGERVGHVGIATNPLITTEIGWTLIDEHRAGAVFLSLGENRYMGGANASAVNVDFVAAAASLRPVRRRLLYVTDLFYAAKGRVYRDEDLFVVERLQQWFDIATCGPLHAAALLDGFDAVVVRNSGPTIHYAAEYETFRKRAHELGAVVYNPLSGRADMVGKQYLVDLTSAGYPVIPTVDKMDAFSRLPQASEYVIKPKFGSDSIGLRVVDRAGVAGAHVGDDLIQPHVELARELSFYAIDDEVRYVLATAEPSRRWQLVRHEPTAEELAFATQFLRWNGMTHGIQRVDGCRTTDGQLLLMELEDLNPYLSLDVLGPDERERFVERMAASIGALIDASIKPLPPTD